MVETYALADGKSIYGITESVESFLRITKKMDTQIITVGNGYIVQARTRSGALKQFIGMDMALTVRVESSSQGDAVVEIANGKWLDKVGAAAVSMVVLWPLMVTTAIGTFMQGTLPVQVKSEITRYLSM